MNRIHLVVAFVVLSLAGCTCRPPDLGRSTGEVQWEWVTLDGQTLRESNAVLDFGTISMGARRDATLKVRNTGRGSFTMNEMKHLMGSAVSINNGATENPAFAISFDATKRLAPSEETTVTVSFIPPIVVEPFVDHATDVQLVPEGADVSTLTIRGRALAGACALPEVIDFGASPIGKSSDQGIELNNNGEIPVRFTAGQIDEAADSYYVLGLTDGAASIPVGGTTTITVRFSPQEPREYNTVVNMRRGESCPEQAVQLKGRGVTSCLTWDLNPADAASGLILSYGAVPPHAVKEGTITFKNECTVAVNLSRMRTNEATFAITSPTNQLLEVPAATRDTTTGMWTLGTNRAVIDFRPVAIGPKNGLFLADTDLDTQQAVNISLKGNGGGPKIDARPTPLNFGRVGFTPGTPTPLVANRSIRVTNVGTRPNPPDAESNLHLGVGGYGTMYIAVRPITGTAGELCVGDFDANGNCDSSLSATYDQAVGIEAGTAGLSLPVRFKPASVGPKEYELTIFSNDITAPETKIQILANAIEAPPCNFQVSPTTVAFGLIDAPQVRDSSFTITNLGTASSEICFFSAFEVDATSHPMFSMPSGPTDLELAAGATATVAVRAAPQTPTATAASATGHVRFSVPTVSAGNSGTVELTATLTPACLTVTPNPLDFGNIQLTCGSPDRTVVISNQCTQSVTYTGATLTDAAIAPNGTGTCATNGGCPQFSLISQGATGVLAPGQSRVVSVRFSPYSQATFTGKLNVNITQGASTAPYEVTLRGTGIPQTGNCVSAVCPAPMTVQANSTVTLNTSVMTTGSPTCQWSANSRPSTSNGTFNRPTNCTSTTYFADVVGTHVASFTVTDNTGASASCQTPITVLPSGDLWIEATWDRNNDVDLHLMHPNAGPVTSGGAWKNSTWVCNWYYDPVFWTSAAASPSLDRDDTTARGPENIRINTPVNGTLYQVGIHMFRNDGAPTPITTTVKVYCGGSLVTTQTHASAISKEMWLVGSVQFPGVGGQACTFTPNGSTIANVAIP